LGRYLLRRLLHGIFVIWAAFTITFAILYLLPSNPIAIFLSGGGLNNAGSASAAQIAALNKEYGFNKPVVVQYFDMVWKVLHGNLGTSIESGQSVSHLIWSALPYTIELGLVAVVFAVVIGTALALWATYTRMNWLRQFLAMLPSVGNSVPTFWSGLILIQIFSFKLALVPAYGDSGIRTLILPAITLALPTGAVVAQLLIRSLTTTLREPYVETLIAKGSNRWRVYIRHALRNASLPSLTMVGVLVGNLLAGATIVETVFSRNGIGRLTATAVEAKDIPVVQGIVLLAATTFVLSSLAVDLLYPILDPRIRRASTGVAVGG
jgi:peptide/nickel transport system permease protein